MAPPIWMSKEEWNKLSPAQKETARASTGKDWYKLTEKGREAARSVVGQPRQYTTPQEEAAFGAGQITREELYKNAPRSSADEYAEAEHRAQGLLKPTGPQLDPDPTPQPVAATGGRGGGIRMMPSTLKQQQTSQTTTYGVDIPGQFKTDLTTATKEKKQAADSLAEAQMKQEGLKFTARQLAQQKMDADRSMAEAETAERVAKAKEYDEQVSKKLRDRVEAFEIDQDRVWSGVGGIIRKIAMSIAAGAKGFAMAELGIGGPNPVIQQMNKLVDRDIAVQKAHLAKMERQLKDSDSVYARMMTESKSPMQAHLNYKIYLNDKLKNALSMVESRTSNPAILARTQSTKAALDEENVKNQIGILKDEHDQVSQTDTTLDQVKRKPVKFGGSGSGKKGKTTKPKQPSGDSHENLRNFIKFIRKATALKRRLLRGKHGMAYSFNKLVPNTDAETIQVQYAKPVANMKFKATIDKGALTGTEKQDSEKAYDAYALTAGTLYNRASNDVGEVYQTAVDEINTLQRQGINTSGYKKTLREAMEDYRSVRRRKGAK